MKKIYLTLAFAATLALPAMADYTGAGYYRVQNYYTSRWAEVVDNTAAIDIGSQSIDLHSVQLQKNFDEVCCDPASVLYITPVGDEYNIEAQGTDIKSIVDYYLSLASAGSANGQSLYYAYATAKVAGMTATKFLCDPNSYQSTDIATMGTFESGLHNADQRKWYIKPISDSGDNYFGAKLSVKAGNNYYASMYTAFPYSPKNSKVYYIKRVGHGMAEMIELKGTIPSGTPVIIEGTSGAPTDNRMSVGGNSTPIVDNIMKGVFFDNTDYQNFVKYDANTMRVLGTCSDGSLGFVTASLSTIPANTAYITVPVGSPAEFKCVTTAEYDSFTSPEALYIVGTFNNWVLPESANSYITLKKTAENMYSGTITWNQAGQLEFKVFDSITNDMSHAYGATVNDEAILSPDTPYSWTMKLGSSSNFAISNWGGGTGTVNVNLDTNTLTVTTGDVQPEALYVVGNFNGWATPASAATYIRLTNTTGKIYKGSITYGQEGLLEFKVFDRITSDWNNSYGVAQEKNVILYPNHPYEWEMVSGNYAKNFIVSNWGGGTGTITVDLENNTLTIETPTVRLYFPDELWLVGNFNNWDTSDKTYKFTYDDNGVFSGEFRIPEVDDAEGLKFKAVADTDWEVNFGAASSNENYPFELFSDEDTNTGVEADGANWNVLNWQGGVIRINLDLSTFQATIQGPDQPEAHPVYDLIWLVGTMNGWNYNYSDYVLEPEGNGVYSGDIELTDGGYYFRFYTQLGNSDANTLSPSENNRSIAIHFGDNDTFTSPIYENTKGSWALNNWGGGVLSIVVNKTEGTASFYADGAEVEVIKGIDGELLYNNGKVISDMPHHFTVFNTSGKVVAKEYGESVSLVNLPKGVYIVVTESNKTLKVVR